MSDKCISQPWLTQKFFFSDLYIANGTRVFLDPQYFTLTLNFPFWPNIYPSGLESFLFPLTRGPIALTLKILGKTLSFQVEVLTDTQQSNKKAVRKIGKKYVKFFSILFFRFGMKSLMMQRMLRYGVVVDWCINGLPFCYLTFSSVEHKMIDCELCVF